MSASNVSQNNNLNKNLDYQALFNELKQLSYPTYRYKQGNCHNMVHYYSMILDQRDIKHKKIWIFAPVRYDPESRECIIKPDPNHLSLKGRLRWGYHVAIIFEHGTDNLIFDTMLDEEKPMTNSEWIDNMNIINYKSYILDSQNYLFYNPTKPIQKKGFKYFKYKGKSKKYNWIPKGLAINETAFEFSVQEKHMLESPPEISKDYKRLVGSVINFECVFRDYSYNHRVTPEFQEKHKDLIEKYRTIYDKNLNKWIDKMDYLNQR
jgi:hypothetical protein